jgi:hypothetical protein
MITLVGSTGGIDEGGRRKGNRPAGDAVFSSEAYGEELALRFFAAHVPFDPDRRGVSISGTAARAWTCHDAG